MKIHELIEARSHSEQNPHISINQLVKQYQQASERFKDIPTTNAFVSFTDLEKLGVNPQSQYETPMGIYAYPLDYVISTAGDDQPMTSLPFAGESPWANFFRARGHVIELAKMTRDSQFNNLIEHLRDIYIAVSGLDTVVANDKFNELMRKESPKNRASSAGSILWHLTMSVSEALVRDKHSAWYGKSEELVWTMIFRRMGVDGCVDLGAGIIHRAEPTQAVFFSRSAVTDVERAANKYSPVRRKRRELAGELLKKSSKEPNLTASEQWDLNRLEFLTYLFRYDVNEFAHELRRVPIPDSEQFIARYQRKIPQNILLNMITFRPATIRLLTNPSEQLQLAAITSNSQVFKLIKHPTQAVRLSAVTADPANIKYIGNPDQQLQTLAVKRDPTLIKYIKRPTEHTAKLAQQGTT